VHYWRILVGILSAERRVLVVANSIGWGLCNELISSYYSGQRVNFEVVNASKFYEKKGASFIIVLGGQLAYEGIGNISSEILPERIQNRLVEDPNSYVIYSTLNFWADGQQIIVLAGHDRYLTRKAVEEAFKSG